MLEILPGDWIVFQRLLQAGDLGLDLRGWGTLAGEWRWNRRYYTEEQYEVKSCREEFHRCPKNRRVAYADVSTR